MLRLGKRTSALLMGACITLAGCSSTPEQEEREYLNYLVNAELVTTNNATTDGISNDANLLTERLYPSAYINGPKGQIIPNPDFIDAKMLPGVQQKAVFQISEDARFSDGQPLTCDSFALAYIAATHEAFHAFLPLMSQVEQVNCTSGEKTAEVIYRDGYGDRWRQTFGAGSLLPVHAIAAKLNRPMGELIDNPDDETIQEIAQIWNQGFRLDNFDAELQVSSGPYRITRIGDQGEVYLERNKYFAGSPAETDAIAIWPRSADTEQLTKDHKIAVAEVPSLDATSWADRDSSQSPYQIEAIAGVLSEQLVLSSEGILGDPHNRSAFAACIDQNAVAQASSQNSGVDVEASSVRTARLNDPAAQRSASFTASHLNVRPDMTERLRDQTIKIAYAGPDERYAAMIDAIRDSCGQSGINIEDVSSDTTTIGGLGRTGTTGTDETNQQLSDATEFDAYLLTIDPEQAFPDFAKTTNDLEAARTAELESWDKKDTIPLAAQPRVFVIDKNLQNVVVNTSKAGIGWNLDRWRRKEAQ